MNHETTIKRIQELVPDVMKLEFGCEFMYEGKKCTFIQSSIKDYIDFLEEDAVAVQTAPAEWIEKDIKILGKPITLAVVMRAIDKKHEGALFATLASNGWLHFGSKRTFWNLSQDNFNDQSDETKAFIGELLN